MRNLTLYALLEAFTVDAGMRLTLAACSGDEIPFEVVPSRTPDVRGAARNRAPSRSPLYCYRPLTGGFIRERLGLLVVLPSYAPAARALEGVGGTDAYLRSRGEPQIPDTPRGLADTALRLFLGRVFEERSEFGFDEARFEVAYDELERAIYRGRCVTEMVAPLLGLDLDPGTDALALGDGLSILRPQSLGAAPAELMKDEQPPLLLVLRVAHERAEPPAVAFARARFGAVLTALRLYEKGSYAIGTIGYSRIDDDVWSPVALGSSGRPRLLTLIPAGSEDELRGFCNLVSRRLPGVSGNRMPDNSGAGEVAWALARFEMGAERTSALEALTDYLMALRALLEPEGPGSWRLAQRLAVICAGPEDRAALAERIAEAVALERSVIAGLAPARQSVSLLVEEVAEHLRAILRDVLCGHLAADVCGVADELLNEAAFGAAA